MAHDGNGRDTVKGDADDNFVFGGNGPDTLKGRRGDDIFEGGNGPDTFVFKNPSTRDGDVDRIVDFENADQGINLSKADLADLELDYSGGNTIATVGGWTLVIENAHLEMSDFF